MRRNILFALFLMFGVALFDSIARAEIVDDTIARGRYLVSIGGCNDCHTPSYPERAGQVPESEWLTGSSVGYQGPWGTSYAANLRLTAEQADEAQFVARARSEMLPPMPWFNLAVMKDDDLKAVYAFIKSLGAFGKPAPSYVAPGIQPTTPYIVFVPQIGSPSTVASN